MPACRSNESWGECLSVFFHTTHGSPPTTPATELRYMFFLRFCSGATGVNKKSRYTVLVILRKLERPFLEALGSLQWWGCSWRARGPHSSSSQQPPLHHCQYDHMFRPKNVQKQGNVAVRRGNASKNKHNDCGAVSVPSIPTSHNWCCHGAIFLSTLELQGLHRRVPVL